MKGISMQMMFIVAILMGLFLVAAGTPIGAKSASQAEGALSIADGLVCTILGAESDACKDVKARASSGLRDVFAAYTIDADGEGKDKYGYRTTGSPGVISEDVEIHTGAAVTAAAYDSDGDSKDDKVFVAWLKGSGFSSGQNADYFYKMYDIGTGKAVSETPVQLSEGCKVWTRGNTIDAVAMDTDADEKQDSVFVAYACDSDGVATDNYKARVYSFKQNRLGTQFEVGTALIRKPCCPSEQIEKGKSRRYAPAIAVAGIDTTFRGKTPNGVFVSYSTSVEPEDNSGTVTKYKYKVYEGYRTYPGGGSPQTLFEERVVGSDQQAGGDCNMKSGAAIDAVAMDFKKKDGGAGQDGVEESVFMAYGCDAQSGNTYSYYSTIVDVESRRTTDTRASIYTAPSGLDTFTPKITVAPYKSAETATKPDRVFVAFTAESKRSDGKDFYWYAAYNPLSVTLTPQTGTSATCYLSASNSDGGAEIKAVYVPSQNKIFYAWACNADGKKESLFKYRLFDQSSGVLGEEKQLDAGQSGQDLAAGVALAVVAKSG